MTRPIALVTGASSGIGREFARELAARGHDLIVVARRESRLVELATELTAAFGVAVRVEVADLESVEGTRGLCDRLDADGVDVHTVVANAGYGLPGAFTSHPWETHEGFLRLMLQSPCELAWRLLPGMKRLGGGRIILVASVAGLLPSPGGHTLYGAVKSALIHFAMALGAEARPAGIGVTALCPGFTFSEFHDVTGTRGQVSKLPRVLWLDARRVAREGIEACDKGRAVWVPGLLYRFLIGLVGLIPLRLRLFLAGRAGGSVRDSSD